MRQLKTFMRNRKKEMLGCGDCECRTLQCRRHVNENCGCGGPGGPSVIWDADYPGTTLKIGESYTLGLTVNPKNTQLSFSTNAWYIRVTSYGHDESGHYNVEIEAVNAPNGLNNDTIMVYDQNGNLVTQLNDIYAIQPLESISIDTSPLSTYQGGYARLPFTYSPTNAFVGIGSNIMVSSDDTNICYCESLWNANGEGIINVYGTGVGTTQVHIYEINNPSDVYDVDVTVNPAIESITLDANSVNIDLDNQPTVSVGFDYLPVNADISSIGYQSNDASVVVVDSIEKDSDGRGHIILTGKNAGVTSISIGLTNGAGYGLEVNVTSIYPDVVAINNIAGSISVRSGETVNLPFEYRETNARFGSIALVNDFSAGCDLELIKDSDGIGHVEVTGHCPDDGYCGGYGNLYLRNGNGYSFYVDVQPSIEEQVLSWFDSTSVFGSLSPEQQEEANEKAREIIEEAGDDIIPFYEAMQEGRTFAYYAEQMGLTPDTSGSCDSSVYTDDEAFIIYIGTAGAVSCEYLALVARRGITPHQELINKQAISDYLDWVTSGQEYTYQFKDWDGEILKFGSVKSGETPIAPEDPIREGYEFVGWSPVVGPIVADTDFIAQYQVPVYATPLTLKSLENNNSISFYKLNNADMTIPLDYSFDGNERLPVNWNNPQWTLGQNEEIMFRSRSTETTGFNFMSDDREQTQNYWMFTSDGPWECSGDVTALINKKGTDTLTTNNVFALLFGQMPHLKTTPSLPAINLTEGCYAGMFSRCGDLATIPELPATTLPNRCYSSMFAMCWGIRLSETETGEYQYPFRIPTTGEGTALSAGAVRGMFYETGGTYAPDYSQNISINTTYYCANSKFVWSSNYLQALDTENLIVGDPNGPHFQVVCHTNEDWVEIVSSTSEMALYNLGNYGWQGSRWDKGTQRVVNEITKVYNAQQQYGTSYVYMNNSIFNAMVDMCEYNPYDRTGDNQYLMAVSNAVALGDWTGGHPVAPHIETITLDGQGGVYGKPVTVEQGYSVNVHCTYTPTNTTNFGTVSLDYYSYDVDVASVEFHPQGNGEGYVTFTGIREGRGVANLQLDGEGVDSVDITVTPHESSYEPSYESSESY